jgi:hypothetical protein
MTGIFIGRERDAPKALCIGMLPTSAMMLAPQVALAYAEGPRLLTRLVGLRWAAWLRENGYDRFMGVNHLYSDELFMRAFSFGGKTRRIGSIIEWRL